jgi:hypothetical protein
MINLDLRDFSLRIGIFAMYILPISQLETFMSLYMILKAQGYFGFFLATHTIIVFGTKNSLYCSEALEEIS